MKPDLGDHINVMALCAGIAGIELGLRAAIGPAYRTVCYVEREAFCASVLAARMEDGRLHDAPIWSDLATFDGRPWRGLVDIITAGYPCQPFSVAGKRGGENDPRHLWPHVARVIGECQPAFAFLENVPGHVSMGLRDVCADLRCLGYDVQAGIFSAAECGAPHLRKRLFVLAAHAERDRVRHQQGGEREAKSRHPGPQGNVADSDRQRCEDGKSKSSRSIWDEARGEQPERLGRQMADSNGVREPQQGRVECEKRRRSSDSSWWWAAEPDVGRVVDAFSGRVDRLRALGNAVVPAVAAQAFVTLYAAAYP